MKAQDNGARVSSKMMCKVSRMLFLMHIHEISMFSLTMYRMKTRETRRLATAKTLTMALIVKARAAPAVEVRASVR